MSNIDKMKNRHFRDISIIPFSKRIFQKFWFGTYQHVVFRISWSQCFLKFLRIFRQLFKNIKFSIKNCWPFFKHFSKITCRNYFRFHFLKISTTCWKSIQWKITKFEIFQKPCFQIQFLENLSPVPGYFLESPENIFL